MDRQVVSVIVQRLTSRSLAYPSLVLNLKLRNVSDNVVFQPMDTYFDRKWMRKGDQPPLTILELLDARPSTIRFFGGPAEYHCR